jgi:CheY-like chemotaxis protein
MSSLLVIDDDDDIRELLMMLLEDAGHHVVSAANGLDAQQLMMAGLRPDLIILDLMMPVMSGWELRHWMLRNPELASIPTIIITGDKKSMESNADLHATACLSKPFELQQLFNLLPG